jgi:hypothetical protein
MSQYREGQRVIFTLPALSIYNTEALIVTVLRDRDQGNIEDRYRVQVTEGQRRAGLHFSIANGNITQVLNNPVEVDPLDQLLEEIEEEEDQPRPNVPPIQPFIAPDINAFVGYENARNIAFEGQVPVPGKNGRKTGKLTYNEMEPATPEDIANNNLHGTAPVGMLQIGENRRVPVYDAHAAIFMNTGLIDARDYEASINRQYFLLWTVGGMSIQPSYDKIYDVVCFKHIATGEIWMNECQQHRIVNTDCLRDIHRVRWTKKTLYEKYLERNGIPKPTLKPKKNLRRKYKEMPKIKEEKYYADRKEFIA